MKPYTGFEKHSDEELIAFAENGTELSQELAKRYAATIDAQREESNRPLRVFTCPECGQVNNPFK